MPEKFDGKAFGREIVDIVKHKIDEKFRPIEERLDRLERELADAEKLARKLNSPEKRANIYIPNGHPFEDPDNIDEPFS